MSNSYNLINPYIKGNMGKKVKAKNSMEAANKLYKNLSQNFNNNIPEFIFSIQKGNSGTGKYYHFKVEENKDNTSEVNYSIEPYTIKNEKKVMTGFNKKLSEAKKNDMSKFTEPTQQGGKDKKEKEKDDDNFMNSSSSSSDENIKNLYRYSNPYSIYYWWYNPYIYTTKSFFVPTFYANTSPYIQIALP